MPHHHATDDFDDFVRNRSYRLLRSAYLLTGDQQMAEDLVQDALVRTFRSWSRLQRTENAEAYARKVMYHLQVAWWRRDRVKEYSDEVIDERSSTYDPYDDVARRMMLRKALTRLPPKQRAVIVLRFYEDMDVSRTAGVLGCSQGTVKSQTAKAIKTLRSRNPELALLAERSLV